MEVEKCRNADAAGWAVALAMTMTMALGRMRPCLPVAAVRRGCAYRCPELRVAAGV